MKIKPSDSRNITPTFEIKDSIYDKNRYLNFNYKTKDFSQLKCKYNLMNESGTDSSTRLNYTILCKDGIIINNMGVNCGIGVEKIGSGWKSIIYSGNNLIPLDSLLKKSIWETQLNG